MIYGSFLHGPMFAGDFNGNTDNAFILGKQNWILPPIFAAFCTPPREKCFSFFGLSDIVPTVLCNLLFHVWLSNSPIL